MANEFISGITLIATYYTLFLIFLEYCIFKYCILFSYIEFFKNRGKILLEQIHNFLERKFI